MKNFFSAKCIFILVIFLFLGTFKLLSLEKIELIATIKPGLQANQTITVPYRIMANENKIYLTSEIRDYSIESSNYWAKGFFAKIDTGGNSLFSNFIDAGSRRLSPRVIDFDHDGNAVLYCNLALSVNDIYYNGQ